MLSAQETAFSSAPAKPVTDTPSVAGSRAVLVAAVQVMPGWVFRFSIQCQIGNKRSSAPAAQQTLGWC